MKDCVVIETYLDAARKLRSAGPTDLEEFEKMLEVDIRESKIFQAEYDQGGSFAYRDAYRKVIDAKIKGASIELDEFAIERLDALSEEELERLSIGLQGTTDARALIMKLVITATGG